MRLAAVIGSTVVAGVLGLAPAPGHARFVADPGILRLQSDIVQQATSCRRVTTTVCRHGKDGSARTCREATVWQCGRRQRPPTKPVRRNTP
jgi:hypothetical protein